MAVNPQQNQLSPDQQQQASTGQSYNQDPGLQTNAQGQRQQGTGFTNINKILNAGQGAGQQLGQAIGQGVGQQASQFQTGLGQSQQQFGQGVGQNTYGDQDQQKITDTINSITSPGQTAAGAQKAGADANAQQFQQYLAGGYSGPQQLSNTEQLGRQATNLQQLGQATQSQGGQQGLLQQFVGKGQYTQGQQGLDALLLGQQGQQGLQQARTQASGAGSQLNQAQTQAALQAKQAALQNQAFGQQALGQLTGAIGGIDTTAQQAAQQATAANQAQALQNQTLAGNLQSIINKQNLTPTSTSSDEALALQKAINSGYLNQGNIGQLGSTYAGNINVNNLMQALQNQPNASGQTVGTGQVLTPAQAAQLQALQNLGGSKVNLPSDITQAQLQAALAPNATGYTAPNYLQNALGATGVIGNNVTQSQVSAAQDPNLAADQAQLAALQQKQTQLNQLQGSAFEGTGNQLQPQIDALNAQIAAAQNPQYQTINQLLAAAQASGSPTPMIGPAGSRAFQSGGGTSAPTIGVGTGGRIGV